jgi:hypothetical protein
MTRTTTITTGATSDTSNPAHIVLSTSAYRLQRRRFRASAARYERRTGRKPETTFEQYVLLANGFRL